MGEAQISPGLRLAWRIAEVFALESRSKEIEPIHFLFGICNLEKVVGAGGLELTTSASAELQREARQVSKILSEAGIGVAETAEKIKVAAMRAASSPVEQESGVRRVSRSDASRKLFDRATNHSEECPLEARAFLAILCSSGDKGVIECLGEKAEILARVAGRARNVSHEPLQVALGDLSDVETSHSTDSPHHGLTILEEIDAGKSLPDLHPLAGVGKRFTMLCDLSWECGTEGSLDAMLQRALDELLRVVPAAEHGQILVRDSGPENLYLKAHSSGSIPRLSMSSIRQAIVQKRGFLWTRTVDPSLSQIEANLQAGLYVPMVADGEVFGVICIETSRSAPEFQKSDLQLANALAHQLGLAVANRELRRELRMNVKVMERLMTNFSPQVRARLMQRARVGRLQLGGERATVSIICSDIRGFTNMASNMDAEDVVDLLNDYFSSLSACVFRNEGTINDFVGDAIMAVFGSPEEDPHHCRNALTTAVQMQEAARAVSSTRSTRGKAICEIGIGVHCGEVIHGFIGSNECMEYTVVGHVVNFTARYSAAAQGGEVLLSPEMHQRVWEHVHAEKTVIETKHEGKMAAYRVIRLR
jgi:adenylate cyclase